MRIAFRATEAAFEADESALVCGVRGADAAGRERWLCFQRETEEADPAEDWGVHLEFDDQAYSDYDRVAACRLSRDRLSVDLSGPLGKLDDVTGFDAELVLADDDWSRLRLGLTRVFRDKPGLLVLDET